MLRRLAIVIMVLCLAACGAAMTPAEIQTNGTSAFSAPPEKVFEAVQAALKVEGYEIANANAEKLTIKTNRKLVRAMATGGQTSAMAVAVTRQYIVHVKPDPRGGSTVIAEPRVFQGDADLSEGSVWALDGGQGERALWKRLFQEIKDNL